MRLKVPPALNQFVTRTLDKNQAQTLFKLLLKYRPEDKKQKRDRLAAEAAAVNAGKVNREDQSIGSLATAAGLLAAAAGRAWPPNPQLFAAACRVAGRVSIMGSYGRSGSSNCWLNSHAWNRCMEVVIATDQAAAAAGGLLI
jgi:hypothetical protein